MTPPNSDGRLRTLQRKHAQGGLNDHEAEHLEVLEIRAGLRADPRGNPLLGYSGPYHDCGGDPEATDRWSDRVEHSSDGAVMWDLIAIPYTNEDAFGQEDSVCRSNRASLEVEHGGACCAEGAARLDGCRCGQPCHVCEGDGIIPPTADYRPGEPCYWCTGSGIHADNSGGGCDWLEDSSLHGGGYLVRVRDEPCRCSRNENDDDPWACETAILETINSLSDYPLMEDELHSNIEMHEQMEQWDDYGQDDLARHLRETHGPIMACYPEAIGLELDDVRWDDLVFGGVDNPLPDHPMPTWYRGHNGWPGLCEMSGSYPEGSDDIHWPYGDWCDEMTREMLLAFGAVEG